ncbi:DNA-binding FadR family transcriptional regulator [Ancylobacter sp. 3268]|uniref:FadR/GntR family transcriptional regulator n=1 Tax=Ancylobacter sp. 3268 TaxID=2817752 RepID=UPI00285D3478|nr:FCD domain-containing protein [Ancylobacter sp. 3268]MDR6951381.1 DNA-binding FadR family transcriptional regulator [Ancylobacter sp. 3268]
MDAIADKTGRKGRRTSETENRADADGREPGGIGELVEAIRGIVARTGSMPPERAVAEELNVKRHTLRRALGVLRARGELEPARAGRRASTSSSLDSSRSLINSTNPLEVMELRLMLEPALARLAALRASPVEIDRILRAATTDPDADPIAADMVFHKAIAAGARNALASELYVLLHRVASDGRLRFTDSDATLLPERVKLRDAEHRQIAEAIAARDPEAAERNMWQHLATLQQKITGRLAPGGPP